MKQYKTENIMHLLFSYETKETFGATIKYKYNREDTGMDVKSIYKRQTRNTQLLRFL